MGKGKTLAVIVVTGLIIVSTGFAQTLDENWNDFLHYTKIGRFDLAKSYQKIEQSAKPRPDAVNAILAILLLHFVKNGVSFKIKTLDKGPKIAKGIAEESFLGVG